MQVCFTTTQNVIQNLWVRFCCSSWGLYKFDLPLCCSCSQNSSTTWLSFQGWHSLKRERNGAKLCPPWMGFWNVKAKSSVNGFWWVNGAHWGCGKMTRTFFCKFCCVCYGMVPYHTTSYRCLPVRFWLLALWKLMWLLFSFYGSRQPSIREVSGVLLVTH